MDVRKCDGSFEEFNPNKVKKGIQEAYSMAGEKKNSDEINEVVSEVCDRTYDGITTQEIRRNIEEVLVRRNFKAGRQYILHWAKREAVNQFVIDKERFIAKIGRASCRERV